MYASGIFFAFFLLFASLVNALPTGHHRFLRGACPGKSSSNNSTVATPTAALVKNLAVIKSATSASPKSSATSAGGSSSSPLSQTGSSILPAVFPAGVKTGNEGWTTVEGATGALPLSDSTFEATKIVSHLSHPYDTAPDGKKAMKAHYAKGSFRLSSSPAGGLSFYAPGPQNVDLTTAKEATLGYSVYFDKNFQWNKGGKLPGLC
jgi:hypothetical protein